MGYKCNCCNNDYGCGSCGDKCYDKSRYGNSYHDGYGDNHGNRYYGSYCECEYCDIKAYRKRANSVKAWSSSLAFASGVPVPKRCKCANLDRPDCECRGYYYKPHGPFYI